MYKNKYDSMSHKELFDCYFDLISSPKIYFNCAELRLCEIAIIRRFLDDVRSEWSSDDDLANPFNKRYEIYKKNFKGNCKKIRENNMN